MRRFTETCKWDDPWFRGLTGVQKLVFLYVIDRCNNAGFWEVDEDSMAFHTKLKPELIAGAWKGLARGLFVVDGWIWVRRFLCHQKNAVLNPENNAHKQIILLLGEQENRFSYFPEFKEFLAPYKPLLRGSGTGRGKGTLKEEEVQEEKPASKEIVTRWNSLPSPFGKVQRLSDDRSGAIRTRLKDKWWRENWGEGIHRLESASFAQGKNDKNWIMSFDFFLKPSTLTKILEGLYDNSSKNGHSAPVKPMYSASDYE